MKANEFMIGASVYFCCFGGSKIIVHVTGFNDGIVYGDSENGSHWCNIEKVEPIPITPEILEKNGFEWHNKEAKYFPNTWCYGEFMLEPIVDGKLFLIVSCNDYDDEETNYTPFTIKYVHELHQALRLCGIEKEIEL